MTPSDFPNPIRDIPASGSEQTVVLAGGCFWCVEGVFAELEGVLGVRSGYAGGTADTANYRAVCSGATDHAEAVEVRFDPGRLTFGEILKVFFAVAHDPTELNRQGNDIGRQYRSAIFYADPEQQAVADAYVKQLNAARVFGSPIVTRLEPLQTFYEAEGYHQEYAARNPDQPYVACVALPKMRKLRTFFPDRLKRG